MVDCSQASTDGPVPGAAVYESPIATYSSPFPRRRLESGLRTCSIRWLFHSTTPRTATIASIAAVIRRGIRQRAIAPILGHQGGGHRRVADQLGEVGARLDVRYGRRVALAQKVAVLGNAAVAVHTAEL